MKPLSYTQIRRRFLDYFHKKHHHALVPSAKLIPFADDSLLFTNAGMVPFKDYFMGKEVAPYASACSVQKCMRAGGKHNDLDNVGHTARHHTFFEMLGNFSFGSHGTSGKRKPYFKEESIHMAWDFLTQDLGLPRDRLRVTHLVSDTTTPEIWRVQQGLDTDQIIAMGEEDNFWSMGDTGPCGPCTEIFWDMGDDIKDEDERWVELWNLVFMEEALQRDGSRIPLQHVAVDTGMGLERLASVLQGKTSNWETDSLQMLTAFIDTMIPPDDPTTPLQRQLACRVIADHARACAFLIADGIRPGAASRGYVLRRIIRRAVKYGSNIGLSEPFLGYVVEEVARDMATDYPELTEELDIMQQVLRDEEELFLSTLGRGYSLFTVGMSEAKDSKVVPPELAFKLYDSCGFPIDLTQMLANEQGLSLDVDAVNTLMEEQRERGRANWAKQNQADGNSDVDLARRWEEAGRSSHFVGRDQRQLEVPDARVLAVTPRDEFSSIVMLDRTPFYPRGGGQVGDIGTVTFEMENGDTVHSRVLDSYSLYNNGHVCVVEAEASLLPVGLMVHAQVDPKARQGSEAHHTATHILHAALRSILGRQVQQAGSLVEPDRLRFDFTHPKALTPEELTAIEDYVNDCVTQDLPLDFQEMTVQDAQDAGAIGLFTNKYGERVKVVSVPDWSMEMCGGTHVERTRDIAVFRIRNQSAVSSGVRRIEAVCGPSAIQSLLANDRLVSSLAQVLEVAPSDVYDKVQSLRTSSSKKGGKGRAVSTEQVQVTELSQGQVQGSSVSLYQVDGDYSRQLKQVAASEVRQRDHAGVGVHIFLCGHDILCTTGSARAHAQQVLQALIADLGGRGGGNEGLARGALPESVTADQVREWLEAQE